MKEFEDIEGECRNRGSNPRGVAIVLPRTYVGSVTQVTPAGGAEGDTSSTPPKRALPPQFLASIRSRGLGIKELAQKIGSHRPHVNRVLLGYPNCGGNTRKRLARHLTEEELDMLGWGPDGRLVLSNAPVHNVPHGTFRATWHFAKTGGAV